jgi:hypothetical protein
MKDVEVTFLFYRCINYLHAVCLVSCDFYRKHFNRNLSTSILRVSEFPRVHTHEDAIQNKPVL